jgi:hypothetical protein
MSTHYFHMTTIDLPWEDYGGEYLAEGIIEEYGTKHSIVRAGPFHPPFIIADICPLATQIIKDKFEGSGLKGFGWQAVHKKKISMINWQEWDFNSSTPPFIPEYKSVKEFLLAQPHAWEAETRMGAIWEMTLPYNGVFVDSFTYQPGDPSIDIMMGGNSFWILVTPRAKAWIETHCGEWVKFEAVDVAT